MMTTAIPYLCVQGAAAALDFYRQAFGAAEEMRLSEPGGRIGHAEIQIDGARIMLSDEYPEYGILSPKTLGGAAVSIHLSVPEVDAFTERAVAAGATLKQPVADQFYGERTAKLEDPFGHSWHISTTTEEVSVEEMQRRYDAMLKG
jgi:uncharacterized glyoxalase superfamily protein PhnB